MSYQARMEPIRSLTLDCTLGANGSGLDWLWIEGSVVSPTNPGNDHDIASDKDDQAEPS
jgi:hypothetical protein